jgi:hypothetical protein
MNRMFAKVSRVTAAAMLVAGTCGAAEINGDSFRITLPAAFAEPVKSNTEKNGIETTTWVSKAPTGEAVVVSVSKMPAKIADPVKLMDSTRDSLLKSVNGTLDSEQNLTGDIPSRTILFRSGTAAFLRSRLAVDGDRLYNVLYVARSEDQRGLPSVGQIFDSFKIVPAAMQPAAPTSH